MIKTITTNEYGLNFLRNRNDISIHCIKYDPGTSSYIVDFIDVQPKVNSYAKFFIRKK